MHGNNLHKVNLHLYPLSVNVFFHYISHQKILCLYISFYLIYLVVSVGICVYLISIPLIYKEMEVFPAFLQWTEVKIYKYVNKCFIMVIIYYICEIVFVPFLTTVELGLSASDLRPDTSIEWDWAHNFKAWDSNTNINVEGWGEAPRCFLASSTNTNRHRANNRKRPWEDTKYKWVNWQSVSEQRAIYECWWAPGKAWDLEAGKMAQWSKYFPNKHEDQRSDNQNLHTSQVSVQAACNPQHCGGRNGRFPGKMVN